MPLNSFLLLKVKEKSELLEQIDELTNLKNELTTQVQKNYDFLEKFLRLVYCIYTLEL